MRLFFLIAAFGSYKFKSRITDKNFPLKSFSGLKFSADLDHGSTTIPLILYCVILTHSQEHQQRFCKRVVKFTRQMPKKFTMKSNKKMHRKNVKLIIRLKDPLKFCPKELRLSKLSRRPLLNLERCIIHELEAKTSQPATYAVAEKRTLDECNQVRQS